MKFIFLVLLFNIIIINFIKSIIVFPLKRSNPYTNSINPYEFINAFHSNNIYSIIKIGEPPQNLELLIKEDEIPISINSLYCNLNEFYNKNISKTFKNLTNFGENIFYMNNYLAQESFYFYTDLNLKKEEKFENIQFIFEKEKISKKGDNEIYNNCGVIGLGISRYINERNKYNLISQLKKLDLIKEYTWTIKFIENDKNDIEGYLIIGDYPHIYDNKNYIEINIRTTLNNMEQKNWNLEFKNITINSTSLTHYLTGIISINTNFIIGTEEYKSKIGDLFFNNYIEKNICFNTLVNSHYFLYYCSSNEFNKNDINNFPTLNFYHFEYNFTFSFNGSDLFLENNGYYYFLIIFDIYDYRNWNFGKLFLKKYQLIFNPDSRTIYYYIKNEQQIIEEDKNYKINNKKIIFIILIIIGFFSFIIGLLIGTFIYSNKNRKRAKEMKDEYFFEKKESSNEDSDSDNIEENITIDSIKMINN